MVGGEGDYPTYPILSFFQFFFPVWGGDGIGWEEGIETLVKEGGIRSDHEKLAIGADSIYIKGGSSRNFFLFSFSLVWIG